MCHWGFWGNCFPYGNIVMLDDIYILCISRPCSGCLHGKPAGTALSRKHSVHLSAFDMLYCQWSCMHCKNLPFSQVTWTHAKWAIRWRYSRVLKVSWFSLISQESDKNALLVALNQLCVMNKIKSNSWTAQFHSSDMHWNDYKPK